MEVKVLSKELVRPTSLTPNHLRTHKLSFLDQFMPPIYYPMVLFYMNEDTSFPLNDVVAFNIKRSQLLKKSLSETLNLFYPLAGRIKDQFSINCNDEGIYYVEAQVNCPLFELLKNPDPSFVPELLPFDQANLTETEAEGYVAMIQVNIFPCGSIAIGSFFLHMVIDATAATMFIKSWAALTRKYGEQVASPNFCASLLYPQSEEFPDEASYLALIMPFLKLGMRRPRRIVFNASAITSLKTKTTSSLVPNPTRVEAVSALLCKCIMANSKTNSTTEKNQTLIHHTVNIRQRTKPSLAKNLMGNFLCTAATLVTNKETEMDDLVCHLRKAIRKIDGDFVKKLQGEVGFSNFCEYIKDLGKASSSSFGDEINFVGITSWCNFGLYEIDFGWGTPTWVSYCTSNKLTTFPNMFVLMDTKGDGIEAWALLHEKGDGFVGAT